jgi:hypothetical protein
MLLQILLGGALYSLNKIDIIDISLNACMLFIDVLEGLLINQMLVHSAHTIIPKSDCQRVRDAQAPNAEPKEDVSGLLLLVSCNLDLNVNPSLILSCLSNHSYPCIGMLSNP